MSKKKYLKTGESYIDEAFKSIPPEIITTVGGEANCRKLKMAKKGVSRKFWLSRDEDGNWIDVWEKEPKRNMNKMFWGRKKTCPTIQFCPEKFKVAVGRLFIRQGEKKAFRLITEERYQELVSEAKPQYEEE